MVAGLQASFERHLDAGGKVGVPSWIEKLDPAVFEQIEAFAIDVVRDIGVTTISVARGIQAWLIEQNHPAPKSLDPIMRWLRKLRSR